MGSIYNNLYIVTIVYLSIPFIRETTYVYDP